MVESVKVEGLRELREALVRKIPAEMQGKVLQSALTAGARPIVNEAKTRVPRRTGRLAKAIYSRRNREGSNGVREERVITVRQGGRRDRDGYYWRWIEFGRGVVQIARGVLGTPGKGFFGREVKAVPARPFLRPAFENRKTDALEAIRVRLAKGIAKAAEKARWRTSKG
jgi:HK97 gp10 family phage protein